MLSPRPFLAAAVPILAAAHLAAAPATPLPRLSPATLGAWNGYIAAIERRIAGELAAAPRFLAMDFSAEAVRDRRLAGTGAIVVRPGGPDDRHGGTLDIASATIHHWRGAVLIPRVRLAHVIRTLQEQAPPPGEDVLQSAVISRDTNGMTVYLKLRRRKFVTVVYDTEHHVRFRQHGPTQASSMSTATKIAELEAVGTASERPTGTDRGYLWRLQSYWRYVEVAEGVIAECESITLSRDIPGALRYLAMPVVRSTARESMERTLIALRDRFAASRMPPGSWPVRSPRRTAAPPRPPRPVGSPLAHASSAPRRRRGPGRGRTGHRRGGASAVSIAAARRARPVATAG